MLSKILNTAISVVALMIALLVFAGEVVWLLMTGREPRSWKPKPCMCWRCQHHDAENV